MILGIHGHIKETSFCALGISSCGFITIALFDFHVTRRLHLLSNIVSDFHLQGGELGHSLLLLANMSDEFLLFVGGIVKHIVVWVQLVKDARQFSHHIDFNNCIVAKVFHAYRFIDSNLLIQKYCYRQAYMAE